jgi:nicotinamide-nucleotide amidase
LIDRQRVPTVGITVSHATITLRIAARATSDQQFAELIAPTLHEIHQALGELVFGVGEDELENAIFRQLTRQQLTMACVEIGAACWISQWMLAAGESATESLGKNAVESESACGFVGGLAFPTVDLARGWLTEPGDPAQSVWEPLARQAQQRFAADIVLMVSGYPTAKDMEASAGKFNFDFVLAIGDDVFVEQRSLGGHPDVLGQRVAKTGLDWLRQKLALRLH